MAVVITSSPRKPAHSLNPLFEVMTREVFSCIELTNLKNRLASALVTGRKPTSSITTRSHLL